MKQTTIIPFYLAFLNEDEKRIVFENFIHSGPINITKSILGLKDLHSISIDFKLKFCYQCWLDSNYAYFDLEHQVQNNFVCYKHATRLQYIIINSEDYYQIDNLCISNYIEAPYCINQNDSYLSCYTKIASMIHEIIVDGFKDEIVSLKSKIRMKMLNIGYMRSDFNYIENFDEFWGNYKSYNVLNIDKK